MVLVGIDWSEKWHDVCPMDDDGGVLGRRRIDDSPAGLTQLHALIAEHAADPAEVAIGIETPRGLMVQALRAAGYAIYAVNPMAASRYRDRHAVSKKKSDRGAYDDPDGVRRWATTIVVNRLQVLDHRLTSSSYTSPRPKLGRGLSLCAHGMPLVPHPGR